MEGDTSMRTIRHLLGVIAATVFIVGQATATPVLPEGTSITADPTSLLSFDASLNDYVAGGVSAVNDQNIEYLTDDFTLGIDFYNDGLLRLWDNLGTGDALFNYSLQFSFTGLSGSLSDIQFVDASALMGGSLLFSIIDHNTFELTLQDVQFAPGFSHADLGISVDEPSMLALFALGLVLTYAARRRRSNLISSAEITP
jgi:hypothetical protein